MNEADISDLLARKFSLPHWVFLRAVRNSPGYPVTLRTADAVAMGIWPSRGLALHGFEIKSARGDWLNELKKPEKAEELSRFCDHWWIVSSEGVVKEEEVPSPWGWMEVVSKKGVLKLTIKKVSPPLEAARPSRNFLASLLRTAVEQVSPEAQKKAAYDKGHKDGKDLGERITSREAQSDKERLERLEGVIAEFEKASGLHINPYVSGRQLGEAVRLVLEGEDRHMRKRLDGLRLQAEEILKQLTETLVKPACGKEEP